MIADMHRARHLAWELPKIGWDVEILCPDTSYQRPSCVDNDSAAFFAPNTPVHYVAQSWPALFRALGFGTIGWRAIVPMLLAGRKLLQKRRFDVVYISTTHFPLFLLGPTWRHQCGVPFVLDFHDPCYREGAANPTWARPSLKHSISSLLAKQLESRATRTASGLVSVSPTYVEVLRRRYQKRKPDWLLERRHAVIPFASLPYDLHETAQRIEPIIKAPTNPARIVYVGAGGQIMRRSFSLLCRALSKLRTRNPELVNAVRIELYGTMTGWRNGDPRYLGDLAREQGVAELVVEHPNWISYRRSLELLVESDVALILGVDDGGYMPSKLFNYALSGKPLLASLRRDGPAFSQFQDRPSLGHALWFDQSSEMTVADTVKVTNAFLAEVVARRSFDRRATLEPYLASAMARRHAELFQICL